VTTEDRAEVKRRLLASERPRLAVVGLGAMGERIAGRLLDAGYSVAVWNRTAAKADDLVRRGGRVAATPAAAAAEADALITIVADPVALRAISEGAHGIAAGAGAQTTVIQMSTVGPAAMHSLAATLGPRTPLLDAPILGSIADAEQGALTLFVGGDTSLVREWTPLLTTLGRPIHVGPLGAGSAAKLVANSALFAAAAALGEALAFADALGLVRTTTYDVLATTPLSTQAERRRKSVESDSYPQRFKLTLAYKDATLIAEAADTAGADLRLAAAARTWLLDAELAGYGNHDYTALIAQILRSAA
jgi:3-hydroxyisobutyrate dehydrogenase-like beta-hydroxyacid dehydrogenase